MVKAFIKGLMGSKSNEEEKQKEEIPNELPPLAEDAAKEEQEKARLEAEEKAKEKEELKELMEDVPDELTPIEEKTVKEEPEGTKEIDKLKEESDYEIGEKSQGFFSNLFDITKKQGINKKLLDKDLYKGMKDYYSVKTGIDIKSITKKELEDNITKKLDELKLLERNWQKQKEFVEENKKILLEEEKKIQDKTEELKPLLKKMNFYKEVPVGKYFRSKEGVIVKSIFELLNLLKIIDDEVFMHHITKERNDFSLWVKEVVGDKELATKLSNAVSRKDMITILEYASTGKT